CLSRVPDEQPRDYFSDAGCENPLAFRPSTLADYCATLFDPGTLGEGQGIESPVWTLTPGSRLDFGARSLDGVTQPYLQRRIYRRLESAVGTCSLEMRIYSASPLQAGPLQPSLLALHGGSWSARGFGYLGLELTIPHYVEQGFVVYAPFYRLLGNAEGSAACNQATIGEIADDASAALAWVREHAAEFGSAPVPVVFGQSAGAHLALSLAVNESSAVAASILFYPPADFTDFALRAQQGFYTDQQGLGILERVLGVSVAEVDISASPVPENSFPQRIAGDGLVVPPMFMVHGLRDSLVEARQSVRLCDALAGRELLGLASPVAEPGELRQRIACGTDSQLQLIREGQHALDVCLAGVGLPTDLCPSGSEASREQVALAIADAVAFAATHHERGSEGEGEVEVDGNGEGNDNEDGDLPTPGGSGSSGSGLGFVSGWLLLIMVLTGAGRVTGRVSAVRAGWPVGDSGRVPHHAVRPGP
ncbi:MAG: alpha/beta hydrolase, partial [Granulosicoccus sp.]|nr:alpha/beta hydrolase [Granulosicoccus sp.]